MRSLRTAARTLSALTLTLAIVQLTPTRAVGAPSTEWSKQIAVRLSSAAVDAAGNVYATGDRVDRSADRTYMVLYKFGPAGALQWKRAWRPSHAWARGADLAIGDDGSLYLSGVMNMEGYEGNEWFIRKYSPAGSLLWRLETPNWRTPSEVGHAETISGIAVGAGLVAASGYSFGCCGDVDHDGWVRTYDLDGDLKWTSPFEAPHPVGTNDAANAITISGIGRVYVAGWIATAAESDADMADHEIMVQKLGPSGGVVWTHVFFDYHKKDRDGATDVSVRGEHLMVTAESGGNYRGRAPHAWLASLTFDGGVRWTRTWGTKSALAAQPSAVSVDPSGSTYVVGVQRDPSNDGTNAFVRKYSASGSLLWSIALEDAERWMTGTDVFARPDGAMVTGFESVDKYLEPAGGWLWRLTA